MERRKSQLEASSDWCNSISVLIFFFTSPDLKYSIPDITLIKTCIQSSVWRWIQPSEAVEKTKYKVLIFILRKVNVLSRESVILELQCFPYHLRNLAWRLREDSETETDKQKSSRWVWLLLVRFYIFWNPSGASCECRSVLLWISFGQNLWGISCFLFSLFNAFCNQ